MTVREYPNIPVTDTGFLNIKIEITTATAPFAFPSTWQSHHAFMLEIYKITLIRTILMPNKLKTIKRSGKETIIT